MTRTTLIRSIIVGAGLGFLVQNWMMPWILPYGPAIKIDLEDRHKCANIDFTKDYLQAKRMFLYPSFFKHLFLWLCVCIGI